MTENNIVPVDSKTATEETAPAKEEVLDEIPELPHGVSNIIKKLPSKEGKLISESFQLMMSGISPSPMAPIYKKLTTEHIDKIIDYSENDERRHYKYAMWARFYTILYIIIGLGIFVFLTIYLSKDKTDIYMKIIEFLVLFVGGVGAGMSIRPPKRQ
jgi:predicted PurR-regulated permease PerM